MGYSPWGCNESDSTERLRHTHTHTRFHAYCSKCFFSPKTLIMVFKEHYNLRYVTTLTTESEEELKSLLMKEESPKVGLKFNIQKIKIMTSGPITSWQTDRETMETVTIFLGSKITADGDCSHEIKRCLLLGRKAVINLDNTLKSRDIILLTKIHLVKAMVFLVVMYGWRRTWQPTPVLLPGESKGWESLLGCRPLLGCRLWGHTE